MAISYGTAGNGANDQGTLFKLTLAGGFVWAYSLTAATGSVNACLMKATEANDGNLYGMNAGGNGTGLINRMTTSGIHNPAYLQRGDRRRASGRRVDSRQRRSPVRYHLAGWRSGLRRDGIRDNPCGFFHHASYLCIQFLSAFARERSCTGDRAVGAYQTGAHCAEGPEGRCVD